LRPYCCSVGQVRDAATGVRVVVCVCVRRRGARCWLRCTCLSRYFVHQTLE